MSGNFIPCRIDKTLDDAEYEALREWVIEELAREAEAAGIEAGTGETTKIGSTRRAKARSEGAAQPLPTSPSEQERTKR